MLRVSRSTNVMPERDIVKYIRSAIAVDGLNLRFEPRFNVGRHLEEECGRFLQGQSVHRALSPEALLAWPTLGSRLLINGPVQAGNLFDRLTQGNLGVHGEVVSDLDGAAAWRRQAVRLAGAVLGLVSLLLLTHPPAVWGINLFTCEVALVLAGLGLLPRALRRQS